MRAVYVHWRQDTNKVALLASRYKSVHLRHLVSNSEAMWRVRPLSCQSNVQGTMHVVRVRVGIGMALGGISNTMYFVLTHTALTAVISANNGFYILASMVLKSWVRKFEFSVVRQTCQRFPRPSIMRSITNLLKSCVSLLFIPANWKNSKHSALRIESPYSCHSGRQGTFGSD